MSYAWVIRSLWRIHEETKESAFPSFLDSTSIRFIIEVMENSLHFILTFPL